MHMSHGDCFFVSSFFILSYLLVSAFVVVRRGLKYCWYLACMGLFPRDGGSRGNRLFVAFLYREFKFRTGSNSVTSSPTLNDVNRDNARASSNYINRIAGPAQVSFVPVSVVQCVQSTFSRKTPHFGKAAHHSRYLCRGSSLIVLVVVPNG